MSARSRLASSVRFFPFLCRFYQLSDSEGEFQPLDTRKRTCAEEILNFDPDDGIRPERGLLDLTGRRFGVHIVEPQPRIALDCQAECALKCNWFSQVQVCDLY